MGSLAAGPVDLSWAGTGAAGGNRPLGNPEDGPLGADPPLPRLSGSGAGLPGNPLSSLFAEYNAQMVLFIGMPVQLFNTFNHAVPALLCAVFVLTRSLPPSGYYLAGTLLLPSSPLGALLLLPYMAYETLFRRPSARKPLSRLRSLLSKPVFWLAALCTAVMVVFYSHLDGGGQFFLPV